MERNMIDTSGGTLVNKKLIKAQTLIVTMAIERV